MRLEILPAPAGTPVAREVKAQGPKGEFFVRPRGEVVYRSPFDAKEWPAGHSLEVFLTAAEAWNSYCDEVLTAATEQDELAVVETLRRRFGDLELLDDESPGFWAVIFAQAEEGNL